MDLDLDILKKRLPKQCEGRQCGANLCYTHKNKQNQTEFGSAAIDLNSDLSTCHEQIWITKHFRHKCMFFGIVSDVITCFAHHNYFHKLQCIQNFSQL